MNYYYGPGYGMMGYGGGGFWFLHLIGGLLTFLFWVIVIIIVIRVLRGRKVFNNRRHIWMHSSALDILKERYAKGEINKEEFESKKKDLEE